MTQFPLIWYRDAPESWEPTWYLENCMRQEGFTLILGAPKTHKSMLRRYLLACAYAGRPAFGLLPTHNRIERALVMLVEDHPGSERKIMDTIFRQFETEAPQKIAFLKSIGFRLNQPAHVAELLRQIDGEGFQYVSMDPLINFHTAQENDASDVARVTEGILRLAEKVTIPIVHHTAKPMVGNEKSGRTAGEEGRGSGVFAGAATDIIRVYPGGHKNRHRIAWNTKAWEEPDPITVDVDADDKKRKYVGTWLWTQTEPLDDEDIFRTLEGGKMSVNKIVSAVGRRRDDVLKLLKEMADRGLLNVSGGGPKKATYYERA